MIYLSIIIPAYNEANRIGSTLEKINQYLSYQTYNYEVIIVNDGSSDNSGDVIRETIKNWPNFRSIEYEPNKGKGEAVKVGMLSATGQLRLFMDADNSTDLKEIEKLLPFIGEYPVVIGSRYLKNNSIKIKQPLKRRIISRVSNWVIRRIIGLHFKDTQCGFKLFTNQAAQRVFSRQTISHWSFDIELLLIAKQNNLTIKEVAIDWYDSRGSKINKLPILETAKEVFKIRHNIIAGKYR